jgi:hypothetical protein
VPIDKIEDNPENYNDHPEEQIEDLQASYAEFGQARSMTVQEIKGSDRYRLVADHGFTESLRRSGASEVGVYVIPADWSREKVEAFMAAENELARRSRINQKKLAKLLEQSKNSGIDLRALGSSQERLAQLVAENDYSSRLRELFGQDEAEGDAEDGDGERKPARRRGGGRAGELDADEEGEEADLGLVKQVKVVLYVADLETFERAIRETREVNRGAALIKICQSYINRKA